MTKLVNLAILIVALSRFVPGAEAANSKASQPAVPNVNQAIYDQQLKPMLAREQEEAELSTEPILDAEPASTASPKPWATPTGKPKTGMIKNYSVSPDTVQERSLPGGDALQGNGGWLADNEVELATEPITHDEPESAAGRKPVRLSVSLDHDRVHLDESFTLQVDILAKSNHALGKVILPKLSYFEIINRSQTTGPLSVQGQLWHHRLISVVYLGKQPGLFEIEPIRVKVGNKTYSSQKLKIRVEGTNSGITYRRRFSGVGKTGQALVPAAPKLESADKDGVVFEAYLDKDQAYVNQQVTLTIKLQYVSDEHTTMAYTPPMLSGFITEPLPPLQKEEQISSTKQRLLERHYRTALFPIRPGTFSIAMGKAVISVKNKQQQYLTDVLSVKVLPLPKDVQGLHKQQVLVGCFQGQAAWQQDTAPRTGRPVMLALTLSGQGNLSSAPEPLLAAVSGCRVYLEKIEDTVDPRDKVIFSRRNYHYLVVFEKPGVFALGPARVRAFDPELKTWQTVSMSIPGVTVSGRPKTESQTIITPALDSATLSLQPNKHALTGRTDLSGSWVHHWSFWVVQALGPLLLLGAFGWRRRQDNLLADEQAWRRRQAYTQAKKAMRRLKHAIYDGAIRTFYDGLTKITTDYLAAKFKVPNSYISAERLAGYFKANEIPQALVARFKVALTACEYVRYAAVTLPAKDMHALHKDLKTALRAFEAVWKQKEKDAKQQIKVALVLLLPLLAPHPALAQDQAARFTQANAFMDQGRLQEAEKIYTDLLNQGAAGGPVYFNLGNCYVHQGRLGDAVLAYERAHWLAPRDQAIAFNLKTVHGLTTIRDLNLESSAWVLAIQNLYQYFTADELWIAVVVLYWILIVLLMLWLLWPRSFGILNNPAAGRKVMDAKEGPWAQAGNPLKLCSGLAALALLLTVLWATARSSEPLWWQKAVVLSNQAPLRLRPYPKAEALLDLPEGMSMAVLEQEEAWIKVALDAGHQGWVKRQALGLVKLSQE